MQLTVQNLRTLNLAGIRYETVYQLHVRHFKREKSHRHLIVGGNILGHRQRKRCLTHRRTSGNDDKVGGLPPGSDVVQFMIARRHTRQAVLIGSSFLDDLYRILDDRVNLRVVLLHVTLSQLEQRTLGLLHQVVNINGLVKGFRLDIAREGDELTCQRLLGDDASMIFYICRRGNARRQFRHIARTANILQIALLGQLFCHCPYVNRQLMHRQLANGRIDLLVTRLIETLRIKQFTNDGIRVLVNHQRTQHSTLYLSSLRLYVGKGIIHRLLSAPACSTCSIVLFWHSLSVFGLQRYE